MDAVVDKVKSQVVEGTKQKMFNEILDKLVLDKKYLDSFKSNIKIAMKEIVENENA